MAQVSRYSPESSLEVQVVALNGVTALFSQLDFKIFWKQNYSTPFNFRDMS